jgi:hypothetical protein
MLNLFINHDCNLHCDYCFVENGPRNFPRRLTEEDFQRFKIWLQETGTPTVGVLGGEPTLHPSLPRFLTELRRAGVGPVLFTNGLFSPELTARLAAECLNIVVNYNPPNMYDAQQAALLERNLAELRRLSASVSFSKNFAPGRPDFRYLLEGAARHGVRTIRFDLARPALGAAVASKAADGAGSTARAADRSTAQIMVQFVEACVRLGLQAGLDCCLPLCLFAPAELEFLKKSSLRFSGVCRPALDVLTDLSAVHCMPLADLRAPDVTAFAGEWDLLAFFGEAALELRRASRQACGPCARRRDECQGGCLAESRALTTTPPPPAGPEQSRGQGVDNAVPHLIYLTSI